MKRWAAPFPDSTGQGLNLKAPCGVRGPLTGRLRSTDVTLAYSSGAATRRSKSKETWRVMGHRRLQATRGGSYGKALRRIFRLMDCRG